MTQVASQPRPLTSALFSAREEPLPGAPDWLLDIRRSAQDQFNALGFPTRKNEQWRFTNIDAMARMSFEPAAAAEKPSRDLIAAHTFVATNDCIELVFLNGRYSLELSHLAPLPRGTRVLSLADVFHAEPLVRAHLNTLAQTRDSAFVALNTAFISDGVFIFLPRGAHVEPIIHLLFIATPGATPTSSHPRVLVIAEENAEAAIVETYAGHGEGTYLTNAVTEMILGADARIDHCKLQQETTSAYHIATTQVDLARSAKFVSHSTSLGALLTRNDVNIRLAGEHADATINGLVLMDGSRHCDNHTLLDHAAANCPSHELYKHVLSGKSTCVFKGQILVRKDSQKTDSKQTSKTLLLSDEAVMNSMPALEIYADDVKCTHGSTTGPVDEEQVFYLQSRGISRDAARHLMTYAFAADITRRIRIEPVRARIENFMAASHGLPLDLRIASLGGHDEAVVNS